MFKYLKRASIVWSCPIKPRNVTSHGYAAINYKDEQKNLAIDEKMAVRPPSVTRFVGREVI